MEVTIEELLPPRHEGNRRYAVSVNSPRLYTPFIYKRFEVEEKYDVCDFLGSGQFGIVCLALDTSNGEKVAIKKLENIFRGKHYAQRVIRELLIHSQINHPFVVALEKIMRPVDQDTFHDIYIVMETMKENLQTSLRERAQKSKREPLAPLNAKLIMNQLLRGVQYLHAADVLHRDLKPSNILLNDDQRVKLCDFGLARVIEPGMTQLVVSAPYRPPELFLRNMSDQSNYGPAVDIWSLGCIFADLLLQRPMSLGFLDDQTDLTNLRRIADTIGRPDDDDLSEVMTNDDARPFLKNMFPQTPSRPFSYIFRDVTDKSAVDLLERMLVFNPRKRISIADALQHEYMADMTVDVLAREFDLQPGEVEKLNDVNPPRIKMNVRGPYQSPKEELRKIIFDECLNIQAAR